MKDVLAEKLLANVMGWSEIDVAGERPYLQAIATYKYDEYQQFFPGMRFVESLALWLNQFKPGERAHAYSFVRTRLLFFSQAEISHNVSIAFPDFIRPVLIRRTATDLGIHERFVSKISKSQQYELLRRQSLFLALSDGARIDVFRRANPELSHEQIWQAYEMSFEKADDMKKSLRDDLAKKLGRDPTENEVKFRNVFLMDDFSASGVSYLRREGEEFKGKVGKFFNQIHDDTGLSKLVDLSDLHVYVVLYLATEQALNKLNEAIDGLSQASKAVFKLLVVQSLGKDIPLQPETDGEFLKLVENDIYYDSAVENEHTRKGGGDVKRGFANCSLPVVLHHNTPNNSLFLLWSDSAKIAGLFPRVNRHKE